jgi:RNA polymerase sigma-70 factor, ECF subfamily
MARTDPIAEPADAELLKCAAAGDRDAFAAIYRRNQERIYRFARLMTGSSCAAEDVTQEVFVTLMSDIDRYAPDRAALGTYLYAVARNIARARIRRERRFVELDAAVTPSSQGDKADPIRHLAEAEQATRLRRALATLPSRYREVVILCDVHGVSYAEAARIVGVAIGTIRSRRHRGRQMLVDRWRRLEDQPLRRWSTAAARCLA